MSLVRESLFSLIGNDRRRYHSAILTTYSFEPDFFEQRVMSHLRVCGIHNVNVLLDGHLYGDVVQQTAGRMERTELSSRYSLYPVFQQAIFHPKIWLLIGRNEGLLIVGSGNLTMAGHLSNDEIWGAFHVTASVPDNQAIFAAAWTYVQRYVKDTQGLFRIKATSWITDNASWINDLPAIDPFAFSSLHRGKRIALLYNTPELSIWQQLGQHLSGQEITSITTVSPYYDQNGQALQALQAAYPTATIHVVLDERGRVPATMPVATNTGFYDWKKVGAKVNSHDEAHARLHAKLIHWQTANGTEFCLFGSANVTSAGLGLPNSPYINDEASLFLEAPKGGLLSQLGLVLKKQDQCPLSDFRVTNSRSGELLSVGRSHQRVWLYSAEADSNKLTVYWEADADYAYLLQLFDNDNRLIDTLPVDNMLAVLTYDLTERIGQASYLQVVDTVEQQAVSNKLPITDLRLLFKTNPNSILAYVESVRAELQNGDTSRLLSLLEVALLDEGTGRNAFGSLAHSNAVIRAEPQRPDELPKKDHTAYISADERAAAQLQSPTHDVLELLRKARKSIESAPGYGDAQPDEEEDELPDGIGSEETGSSVSQKQPDESKSAHTARRNQLVKYLRSFTNYATNLASGQKIAVKEPINLTTLTRYLIALELILEYGGRVAVYTDKNHTGTVSYLPVDDESSYGDVKTVKGCCMLLIGRFLQLARRGFETTSSESVQRKVEQYKQEALIDTITCILNVKWHPEEFLYGQTLLLNTLHYLGWSTPDAYRQHIDKLLTAIDERAATLKKRQPCFADNRRSFINTICPLYVEATEKRTAKQFDSSARKGQIIYSALTGYCFIKSSTTSGYIIAKAGLEWNPAQQAFCDKDPITVPKFTLVG